MTKAERELFLRERLIELQSTDDNIRKQGYKYVGGVDEVGRGPLAGPVVTACVVLPPDVELLGVDDSKKLSEKKRESLYNEIIDKAICYGIGQVDNKVIDEINILQATKRAMSMAIENAEKMLLEKTGEKIDFVLFDAMEIKEINKPQQSLIKGDSKSLSIASASIIAKVYRDNIMVKYSETYPGYCFEKNKGYGTKAHYEGLKEHGITPIHRKSFLKNFKEI